MSHVATVQVWRCGWWLDGNCPGTENGCTHPVCKEAREHVDESSPDGAY